MNRKALKTAFPKTIPILTSFCFLGLAYGFYMRSKGFSFLYPMMMSITVFGGSLEFLMVSMLGAAFAPLQTFLMALMVQARHLFYGLAMLEKYKDTGKKKFYLIYGMCDESFSINCSADIPEDVDKGRFMLWVTILDHAYWVTFSTLGALIGSVVSFDTTGIEFVMTALFTVIFIGEWQKHKRHKSELIGLTGAVICLIIFGSEHFLLPTMACILVLLLVTRKAGDAA